MSLKRSYCLKNNNSADVICLMSFCDSEDKKVFIPVLMHDKTEKIITSLGTIPLGDCILMKQYSVMVDKNPHYYLCKKTSYYALVSGKHFKLSDNSKFRNAKEIASLRIKVNRRLLEMQFYKI